MVTIVVYFESLHNFAATSSTQAQQDAASLNDTTLSELRLRYEQGLDLILNAADLEVPCSAIFMERAELNTTILQECLGESLIKKFKQLDLYEIPTLVLAPSNVAMPLDTNVPTELDTNVAMALDTNVASSLQSKSATSAILDFAKVITANEYRDLEFIEAAQNFTV